MRKILFVLLILLVVLSVVGCEGGISGSVSGSNQSCTADIQGGACHGGFKKLSGTISEDMPMTRAMSTVQVNVTASVEEGAVRVYLIAPDDNQTSAVAKPNAPVSISGFAEGYSDSFRVYFEAVDESAKGIKYDLNFTYP